MKITYLVGPECEKRFTFDATEPASGESESYWLTELAEACAGDYHGICPDWDDGDSRLFSLFGPDGEGLGVVEVWLAVMPCYHGELKE